MMRYRVQLGSPSLVWAALGCSGLTAAFVDASIPTVLHWAFGAVDLATLVGLLGWVVRFTARNHTLRFLDGQIEFTHFRIIPRDIEKFQERRSYIIIYFKRRRLPVSVSFAKADRDYAMQELRSWARRDEVIYEIRGSENVST